MRKLSQILCAFCIAAGGSAATAESQSPLLGAQTSKLRLIGSAGLDHGHYDAGIEIAMSPGSHTYWKNPGESGVPPVFSFNGSTNVAKAEVAFPVPTRISEEGLEAFGYTNRVVFPVSVTPNDPSKPSELRVEATYAVCNKICIPAQGSDALALPPGGAADKPTLVSAALADVPRPMSGPERAALTVEPAPSGGGLASTGPAWAVAWKGTVDAEDLFAVAPEGFYFSTKKTGPRAWVLSAEQSTTTKGATSVPVSLVLKAKGQSLTTTETLDLAEAKK